MIFEDIKSIYAQVSRWAFPLLGVLVLACFLTCNRERDERIGLEDRLNASERRTIQIENDRGQLVAQNEQIVTIMGGHIKAVSDSVFALRRDRERLIAAVTNYTRITQAATFRDKTGTYIDTFYKDTGRTVFIEQPQDTNLMRVPRPFTFSDSTIAFGGVVTRKGVRVDSLNVPNTLHIRMATEKTGFLKLGRKNIVQAVNSNPAIQNTGIASIAVKPKAGWWNKWGKPVLVAGASVFIYSKTKK